MLIFFSGAFDAVLSVWYTYFTYIQVYSLDKKDIMMHSFNEHVFVLSE